MSGPGSDLIGHARAMGILSRNQNKTTKASCLIVGEDRRFRLRGLETTGVYYLDYDNRLAFDSFPKAISSAVQPRNGNMRMLGPISLLYEPTSRPYSFADLAWTPEEHKEDVILDTAFAEGCSMAIQREDRRDWFNKLTTILLIGMLGLLALAFMVAMQTGVLSSLLSGVPEFFGG